MLKVMTLVGTRPELIKMSRVIAELDKSVDHVLVHSGQNFDYELNQVFFDDLEIRKPDYFLESAGKNSAETISNVILKADRVMEKERPDAILFYGDTNTCLAVISAKRRKIPVFHMEAGNRCFDQRVPEELNRKVLDHLSDINLVLTEHARRYLIAEGIRPETIIKTGSHMQEVLEYYMPRVMDSNILERLELEEGKFFVVSAHREENVDTEESLRDLVLTLNDLAVKYQYPILVSTHPRTKMRLEALKDFERHELIQWLKPFGFLDYIRLQMAACCILSDSGTITEEAALLRLPAVTIRNAHERPEGMDSGTLIMTGLKSEHVLNSIEVVLHQVNSGVSSIQEIEDYQGGCVSQKVVRAVLSYTDYVNRTVWKKV